MSLYSSLNNAALLLLCCYVWRLEDLFLNLVKKNSRDSRHLHFNEFYYSFYRFVKYFCLSDDVKCVD